MLVIALNEKDGVKMKRISEIFKVLLVFVVGMFLISSINIKANALGLIETIDKASIRVEGEQGLRFYAKVLDSSNIKEKGFYLVYGTTTVSNLENAIINSSGGPIILNGKEVYHVTVPGVTIDNEFSVVLTGIPSVGYLDNITVIPYVISKDDEEKTFANPVTRSVTEVAIKMDEENEAIPSNVNSFLTNVIKVSLTLNELEITYGLKDNLGNYVDLNLYTVYLPNTLEIILPEPEENESYNFGGYNLNNTIYNAGDIFLVSSNTTFTLIWSELLQEETYKENFNSAGGVGSSYSKETSYEDANGFTWNMKGRSDQTLDGSAWTLGEAADESFVEVNATGGIKSFSLDVLRAFTNTNKRTLELFVNDESFGTFEASTTSDSKQSWFVSNINITGDVTIKVISINTGGRGATIIDNFSWTNLGNVSNTDKILVAKDDLEIDYSNTDNPEGVKGNIILKNKGTYNTNISWVSSDNSMINPLTGNVNRPLNGSNVTVTLTATITLASSSLTATKTFTLTVLSLTEFTVSFDVGYAALSTPSPQTVTNGEKAVKPVDPERVGFIFGGWEIAGISFNFNETITSDLLLSAKWIDIDDFVVVRFNSNGGTSVNNIIILKGEQVEKPTNPTKTDFSFAGWYLNSSLTESFDFDAYLYLDITLYAKWEELELSSYYMSVNNLDGNDLFLGLRTIISSLRVRSYGDARYILQITDRDPLNYNNVITVYKRESVKGEWDQGVTWNREHVWPQSKLNGATMSDLHNLKPANPSVNSSKSNLPFVDGSGTYKRSGNGFYPGDEVKGDMARIMFYMITKYNQLDITTMGSLEMFLRWHLEDPVDDAEIYRNEVLYAEQENRNPFIDYPHFVSLIWGEEKENSSIDFYSQYNVIANILSDFNEVLSSYQKLAKEYYKKELIM